MNSRLDACLVLLLCFTVFAGAPQVAAQGTEQISSRIERLDGNILKGRSSEELSRMLEKRVQEGIAAANRRSSEEWRQIANLEQWEVFKRKRLDTLRVSLGQYPAVPRDPRRLTTKVIPGVLTAGDLCDLAGALAPRPLRLEGLVDGLNRRVTPEAAGSEYTATRSAYARAAASGNFEVGEPADDAAIARWLLKSLSGK